MSRKVSQANYKIRGSMPEFEEGINQFIAPIANWPGLIWKIWLKNESHQECAGFYLFQSDFTVKTYLEASVVAALKNHPAVHDLSFKVLDISEEQSRATSAPVFMNDMLPYCESKTEEAENFLGDCD